MFTKLLAVAVVLCWSFLLAAYHHTLFFVGMAKNSSEENVFYNRVYIVAQNHTQLKLPFTLFTFNPHWNIQGQRDILQIKKESIKSTLKTLGKKLKQGDHLLFFLDDHGVATYSKNTPIAGGIAIGSMKTLSYGKLRKWIEAYIPSTVKIRMVADHCFSGSIHHVAFDLPNVCSAATVAFRNSSYFSLEGDGVESRHNYFYGLWPLKRGINLRVAHWKGVKQDLNIENIYPALSSDAYVEKVLKKGAYGKNSRLLVREFLQGLKTIKTPKTVSEEIRFYLDLDEHEHLNLNDMANRLFISKRELDLLPSGLKLMAEMAYNDLVINSTLYYRNVQALDNQHYTYQNQSHYFLIRGSQYFGDRGNLIPLLYDIKVLRTAKNAITFIQKASEKQKNKYHSLVECEEQSII